MEKKASTGLKGKHNVVINRCRFCNVLSSDFICPNIIILGKLVTRREINIGLKKYQLLNESIVEEYKR